MNPAVSILTQISGINIGMFHSVPCPCRQNSEGYRKCKMESKGELVHQKVSSTTQQVTLQISCSSARRRSHVSTVQPNVSLEEGNINRTLMKRGSNEVIMQNSTFAVFACLQQGLRLMIAIVDSCDCVQSVVPMKYETRQSPVHLGVSVYAGTARLTLAPLLPALVFRV